MSRVRIASIIVTAAAAAFLALDTIGTFDRWPAAGRGVHDGAVFMPVVAALCWLGEAGLKRHEKQVAGIGRSYLRREKVLIEAVSQPGVKVFHLPRLHSSN
jgi:hypothetical protein